jgi:hypothetical protein
MPKKQQLTLKGNAIREPVVFYAKACFRGEAPGVYDYYLECRCIPDLRLEFGTAWSEVLYLENENPEYSIGDIITGMARRGYTITVISPEHEVEY